MECTLWNAMATGMGVKETASITWSFMSPVLQTMAPTWKLYIAIQKNISWILSSSLIPSLIHSFRHCLVQRAPKLGRFPRKGDPPRLSEGLRLHVCAHCTDAG